MPVCTTHTFVYYSRWLGGMSYKKHMHTYTQRDSQYWRRESFLVDRMTGLDDQYHQTTATRSPQSIHGPQLLSNLHWLAINKRISFKIVILTYKVLSTQQPTYLSSLISYRHSSHLLRSRLLTSPSERSQNGNRIRPSCLLHLLCSSTPQSLNQIPLVIRTNHYSTVSYTTLKPFISRDSNPPSDCLHSKFKSILNTGVLTNLLHYIT